MNFFDLSPDAELDVWQIWQYLAVEASDSVADKIEAELYTAFRKLASNPHIGHRRPDLTNEPDLFYRVLSYLIIYSPETKPLRIHRVLHAKRDVALWLKRL